MNHIVPDLGLDVHKDSGRFGGASVLASRRPSRTQGAAYCLVEGLKARDRTAWGEAPGNSFTKLISEP